MHCSTMQPSHLHHNSTCAQSAVSFCNRLHVRPRHACRTLVAQAGGNGAENGRLTSEKQREIAKILLQTQKNMLELNNSRVKVQEELATAHRRIADLERELERLRVEQTREQLQKAEQAAAAPSALPAAAAADHAGSFTPQPPPAAAAPAPPAQQQAPPATPQQQQPQQVQQEQQQQHQPPATNHHGTQQQQVVQAAAAPPQQQAPPPPPAPPAVINLTYFSGWHNCFIHYCVDDKPWTSVPGERMTTSKTDHMKKTIIVQGRKMEFVMTNGENDWDSPGRYTEKPKNYTITAPGSYKLKSGKLEKET